MDKDERKEAASDLAVGYAWCVRISTFSLELVVLIWVGRMVDLRWNVSPWGLLVGLAIGLFAFITGLIQTAKKLGEESDDGADENLR